MARCIRCSGLTEKTIVGMCEECCTEAICIECQKWMPVEEMNDYGVCEGCQKESEGEDTMFGEQEGGE